MEEAAAVADTMSTEEVEECLRHIVDVVSTRRLLAHLTSIDAHL